MVENKNKKNGSVNLKTSYNVNNDYLELRIKINGDVLENLKNCAIIGETVEDMQDVNIIKRYKIRRIALGDYGLKNVHSFIFSKNIIDFGEDIFIFQNSQDLKKVIDGIKIRVPELIKNFLESQREQEYNLNISWEVQ